ncbi:hypothetical protein FS837_009986 [Tulasnella sp. UAMH 9824]|nr:hypothetical protein FS837_009986 [Tulasnella sp. UAMH 9824]
MTKVTTVAIGLDGSDATLTPFNWTCPSVTPCSAIYFYQIYDSSTQDSPSWTGRFTFLADSLAQIASPHGASIPPPNATQPNGEVIPWGFGTLASNTTSIPLPPSATAKSDTNSTTVTSPLSKTSDMPTQASASSEEAQRHEGKSDGHSKDDEEGEADDDDPNDEHDDRDEEKYDDNDKYDHHGRHEDDNDDPKDNNEAQNSRAPSDDETQTTPRTAASLNNMANRNVHGANQIPVPGVRSFAATYPSSAAREVPRSIAVGLIMTTGWLFFVIV